MAVFLGVIALFNIARYKNVLTRVWHICSCPLLIATEEQLGDTRLE